MTNKIYVNVPKIISLLKTRMYMGRGIEFKHNDEHIHELWHKFVELNDFYSFMFRMERIKSETGACFITIDKLKDSEMPILNSANPLMASGIGYSFYTPVCAVIISQISINNTPVYCRSVYDKEKVIRTFWNLSFDGSYRLYNEDMIDKLQLDIGQYDKEKGGYVYYHNLGFVPVQVIYNKPFRPEIPQMNVGFYYQSPFTTQATYGNTGYDYSEVKDCANCMPLIDQLNDLYDKSSRLAELYKPRLALFTNNAANGNPLFARSKNIYNSQNDLSVIKEADVIVSSLTNQVKLEQITSPNNLDQYQNQIVAKWIDIFKSCGLSYITQSGTQKTSQESYSAFQGNIEETNFARNYNTSKWVELIVKVFKMVGIDLNKQRNQWSFQVKRNLVSDEASMIDNLIKQYQLKIKTPGQILANIEGIDEDYAQSIVDQNFKWFDKHKEDTNMPQINKPGNADVSGVKMASLGNTNMKKEGMDE